jgi:hypothetical protein
LDLKVAATRREPDLEGFYSTETEARHVPFKGER